MATAIRFLRLLSIVVWVGGIVFFAFVLAPVAFHLLRSAHDAGIVVGGTLRVLDVIGIVCGIVFVAATVFIFRGASKFVFTAEILLVAAMVAATAYIHWDILPAMELDRVQAGGDIETAPLSSEAREHFELLHKRSEHVEGAVLFLGLGVVVLMARESIPREAVKS